MKRHLSPDTQASKKPKLEDSSLVESMGNMNLAMEGTKFLQNSFFMDFKVFFYFGILMNDFL